MGESLVIPDANTGHPCNSALNPRQKPPGKPARGRANQLVHQQVRLWAEGGAPADAAEVASHVCGSIIRIVLPHGPGDRTGRTLLLDNLRAFDIAHQELVREDDTHWVEMGKARTQYVQSGRGEVNVQPKQG